MMPGEPVGIATSNRVCLARVRPRPALGPREQPELRLRPQRRRRARRDLERPEHSGRGPVPDLPVGPGRPARAGPPPRSRHCGRVGLVRAELEHPVRRRAGPLDHALPAVPLPGWGCGEHQHPAPGRQHDRLSDLQGHRVADVDDAVSRGVRRPPADGRPHHGHASRASPGGALHKVVRWAFEQQGLFQPAARPGQGNTVNQVGNPPPVDVFIDDGRNGGYQYQANHWSCQDMWVRRAPDGGLTHEEPVVGTTNYMYVRVQNRGTDTAQNVRVDAYHTQPRHRPAVSRRLAADGRADPAGRPVRWPAAARRSSARSTSSRPRSVTSACWPSPTPTTIPATTRRSPARSRSTVWCRSTTTSVSATCTRCCRVSRR